MKYGKLNPYNNAKISFPGFQEILDFTSAGSESSVSVAVNGDVDKEYKIVVRGLHTSGNITLRLNNDSTADKYGRQYLINQGGTISSGRSTATGMIVGAALGLNVISLLTPTGFIKTAFLEDNTYTSGTTMANIIRTGWSFNSTANVTSIDFIFSLFTTGTRICVYARRSQS